MRPTRYSPAALFFLGGDLSAVFLAGAFLSAPFFLARLAGFRSSPPAIDALSAAIRSMIWVFGSSAGATVISYPSTFLWISSSIFSAGFTSAAAIGTSANERTSSA